MTVQELIDRLEALPQEQKALEAWVDTYEAAAKVEAVEVDLVRGKVYVGNW